MEFKKQNKQVKREREIQRDKPRNRFLTVENKWTVTRGEVGGNR